MMRQLQDITRTGDFIDSTKIYNFWKNTFQGISNFQRTIVVIYMIAIAIVFTSLLYYLISTGSYI